MEVLLLLLSLETLCPLDEEKTIDEHFRCLSVVPHHHVAESHEVVKRDQTGGYGIVQPLGIHFDLFYGLQSLIIVPEKNVGPEETDQREIAQLEVEVGLSELVAHLIRIG